MIVASKRFRRAHADKLSCADVEAYSTPVTETGCWIWLRSIDTNGYGRAWVNGRHVGAHRASYEAFYGAVPHGLHVMHKCDTPSCVNPDHLTAGTAADNMADKMEKGRCNSPRGIRHASSRLSPADVQAIRSDDRLQLDIAKDFNVSHQTIWAIKNNIIWRHTA